jgi:hypothetical protein
VFLQWWGSDGVADGLFDDLKKALAERVLNAELDDHLDGEAAESTTTTGPALAGTRAFDLHSDFEGGINWYWWLA